MDKDTLKFHIFTIGCQMNVYDSFCFKRILEQEGYQETQDIKSADLVLLNTCTVRQKAEEKAYSFLGTLWPLKKTNNIIVVLTGCLVQQEKEAVFKKAKIVDIAIGVDRLFEFPKLLAEFKKDKKKKISTNFSSKIKDIPLESQSFNVCQFITIMKGCNNFCSYCIVPFVRGREKSKEPSEIIREIENFAEFGTKEITLLGQNVNSYAKTEKEECFYKLLEKVNDIRKIERIRFATSHPKDLSDNLINCFASLEKLCSHIHLPLQSASNKILSSMNRKYKKEEYLKKIEKLRGTKNDIAITTDIIVGFPGETRSDFEETIKMIKEVQYDSIFAFIYSDRKNTPAAKLEDKISLKEKKERIQELFSIQKEISEKKAKKYFGKKVKVLVEGKSKKNKLKDNLEFEGRISQNKVVNFSSHDIKTGSIIELEITKALSNSLYGKIVP